MPHTTEQPSVDSTEDPGTPEKEPGKKKTLDGTTMEETGVGGEGETEDNPMPPPTGPGSGTKV